MHSTKLNIDWLIDWLTDWLIDCVWSVINSRCFVDQASACAAKEEQERHWRAAQADQHHWWVAVCTGRSYVNQSAGWGKRVGEKVVVTYSHHTVCLSVVGSCYCIRALIDLSLVRLIVWHCEQIWLTPDLYVISRGNADKYGIKFGWHSQNSFVETESWSLWICW